MLNANSRIKGEKDFAKYEKARKLKEIIDEVRSSYEVYKKNICNYKHMIYRIYDQSFKMSLTQKRF